jgi:hypothetical protein
MFGTIVYENHLPKGAIANAAQELNAAHLELEYRSFQAAPPKLA